MTACIVCMCRSRDPSVQAPPPSGLEFRGWLQLELDAYYNHSHLSLKPPITTLHMGVGLKGPERQSYTDP